MGTMTTTVYYGIDWNGDGNIEMWENPEGALEVWRDEHLDGKPSPGIKLVTYIEIVSEVTEEWMAKIAAASPREVDALTLHEVSITPDGPGEILSVDDT
jgi:hypothetical protein